MRMTRHQRTGSWRHAWAAILCVAATASGALAAEVAGPLSPDADELLRAACAEMAGLKAFTVSADIDSEVVAQDGQKLQFSSQGEVTLQRPDRFRVTRRGRFADVEFIFDGTDLVINGKRANVYAKLPAPGTIDGAITTLEMATGLNAPGADLLFSDPYSILSNGVVASKYLGTGYVNGVECHHLAFREADVDWQLWVQAGDQPLPMKYVITSKWVTGAPQYSVAFRDWNTKPQVGRQEFEFSPPPGSKSLAELPINALGELDLTGEDGQ